MFAEGAFFLCAEAEDGVAGFLIQCVGFEFDAQALPDFEGVAQHQVFGFGVDGGALPGGSDPSGTDFHAAVGAVDIHESRAADYALRIALDGGEDDGFAAVLLGERFFDQALEIFGRLHGIRDPAENVVESVFGGFPEELGML